MLCCFGADADRPSKMAKIYVVFYSTYGHIYTLAKEVAAGVKEAGHQVELFQARPRLTLER